MSTKAGTARRTRTSVPVVKGQADLLTEWRETGLITTSQFATFTRTTQPTVKGR
jgi:hypothetical protein